MKSFLLRFRRPKTIIAIIVLALLMWGGYRLWFAPKAETYQLATVTRGTLVQIVSVTGNTAPVHDVDLAFETGGTIVAANATVGSVIQAGQVIASLDTRDLSAQLAQAQADADAQVAKLRSLQAGSRPEDIAGARAALDKANQDLANMYANVPSALTDGYAKANDAVRNQISPLFSSAETTNPQLTFSINDSQILNNLQAQRVQASSELNAWQLELAAINSSSPTATLNRALQNGAAHLTVVGQMLSTLAQALVVQNGLSQSTLSTYKNYVATALTETTSATTGINSAAQNIASEKLTILGLQADLDKAVAGPTAQDIAAQQALVEQALAAIESIRVKIAKASLLSPVSGTVTRQDAKVGEIATAGKVLISIISDKGLEVSANVPEADIGKVTVGDPASMTLDAFSGKTFSGKVVYIDPGETVIEGVPTYKATFQFDLTPDVKPGMTANIDITTATHENVLYVPQRAVVASVDGGRTAQVYHGPDQELEVRTVTVGIRDGNGNVEIVSGLSEGESVVRSPQ